MQFKKSPSTGQFWYNSKGQEPYTFYNPTPIENPWYGIKVFVPNLSSFEGQMGYMQKHLLWNKQLTEKVWLFGVHSKYTIYAKSAVIN